MREAHIQKGLIVNKIKDKLRGCEVVILTDYRGLTVQDMQLLRSRCRKINAEYHVVKNTLITLALKETEFKGLCPYIAGPTAIGLSHSDPVSLAKVFIEFAKEYPAFKIKAAALLKGDILGPDRVKELATLPPREVLITLMLIQIRSPITRLLNTLCAPLNRLLNLLEAIKEQKTKINGG